MLTYVVSGGAVAAVLFYWFGVRSSAAVKAAKKAANAEDLAPLLQALDGVGEAGRSAFFQRAIGWLWDNWQRPLAVKLIREFGQRYSDQKICQFWLRQVLEVEPLLAQQHLDESFMKSFYHPEVAKTCCQTSS